MERWQLEKSGCGDFRAILHWLIIYWLWRLGQTFALSPIKWQKVVIFKVSFSDVCITTEGTISSKIKLCSYNVKTAVIHNMPILWVIHFLFMMSTKIFQNSASPPSPSTTIWFWSGPFLPFSAMDFHNWPLKNLWAHID